MSFVTSSLEGMSRAPHTLSTSSRACTCHCGCIAMRIIVHVSKLDVVCLPAKKNPLHSSTMSLTVIVDDGEDFDALIINPSKSLELVSIEFSRRRSINFINDFLISLSSLHEFTFVLVGRNLIHQIEPSINKINVRVM